MSALKTSHRHLLIACSVVLFHLGALWAMQTGLIQRAVAAVLPVQLLSEFIEPPQPKAVAQPKPLQPLTAPVAATPVPVAAPKVALPSSAGAMCPASAAVFLKSCGSAFLLILFCSSYS